MMKSTALNILRITSVFIALFIAGKIVYLTIKEYVLFTQEELFFFGGIFGVMAYYVMTEFIKYRIKKDKEEDEK